MRRVLLSLVVAALAVCSRISLAQCQMPLKIGALLCLTGECSEWGTNALMGMRLASDEINVAGGILGRPVELVVQDTKEASGASSAVSAYRNITANPDVQFIAGPTWTVGALPLAPIISQNVHVIVTSPSVGVADFNEAGENIFNLWPHDSFATEGLARFALKRGYQKIAIVSGNDAWVMTQGNTFEKMFKSTGGEVTTKIELDPHARDVRTEALRIMRSAPDAVFYADTYNMSKMARELRVLRFKGAQLSILMDDTRVHEAEGALENTFFAMYPESSADFQKRFSARYKQQPGISADTGYDIVKMYAAAILKANSVEVERVLPMVKTLTMEGVSGKIQFDQYGGVARAPRYYQVQLGAFVVVDSD